MTLTSIAHCLQAPAHAADTPTFDTLAVHWFASLWADSNDASAERWRRDCALFDVADTARRLRRERAWENLL